LGPADAPDLADYACNADALMADGFTQDDVDVATELFGCGLFDIENLWWRDPINAGTSGEFCVYYAPTKSGYGIPQDERASVVVDRCTLSRID
jgi:hypothetical protein